MSTPMNSDPPKATLLPKAGLLGVLAAVLCGGGSCTINVLDPDNPGGVVGYVPLDNAILDLRISQSDGEAVATARIFDIFHRVVRLRQGQMVAINGRPLAGPDAEGLYCATFAAAGEYVITVTEPTRGVSNTTVQPPPGFSSVQPPPGGTASLSGFTVAWTNFDPELDVTVTLTQVLFGAEYTVTFGPFTDTGTEALSTPQLAEFRQGAPLVITVTRILETYAVGGFRSAVVRTEDSDTVSVTPTP